MTDLNLQFGPIGGSNPYATGDPSPTNDIWSEGSPRDGGSPLTPMTFQTLFDTTAGNPVPDKPQWSAQEGNLEDVLSELLHSVKAVQSTPARGDDLFTPQKSAFQAGSKGTPGQLSVQSPESVGHNSTFTDSFTPLKFQPTAALDRSVPNRSRSTSPLNVEAPPFVPSGTSSPTNFPPPPKAAEVQKSTAQLPPGAIVVRNSCGMFLLTPMRSIPERSAAVPPPYGVATSATT